MKLNKYIFLCLFIFFNTIELFGETLTSTQFYAIDTNKLKDENFLRVIDRVHDYYKNNNEIECVDGFRKIKTKTKFIKISTPIINHKNILIDTIKKINENMYEEKVCVYKIENGIKTKLEKEFKYYHEVKSDEINKPVLMDNIYNDIINHINFYSNLCTVTDYLINNYKKETPKN